MAGPNLHRDLGGLRRWQRLPLVAEDRFVKRQRVLPLPPLHAQVAVLVQHRQRFLARLVRARQRVQRLVHLALVSLAELDTRLGQLHLQRDQPIGLARLEPIDDDVQQLLDVGPAAARRIDLGQAFRRRRVIGVGGQGAHVELDGLLFRILIFLLTRFLADAALYDQARLGQQRRLRRSRRLSRRGVEEKFQRRLEFAVVAPNARPRRQRARVLRRQRDPLARRLSGDVPAAELLRQAIDRGVRLGARVAGDLRARVRVQRRLPFVQLALVGLGEGGQQVALHLDRVGDGQPPCHRRRQRRRALRRAVQALQRGERLGVARFDAQDVLQRLGGPVLSIVFRLARLALGRQPAQDRHPLDRIGDGVRLSLQRAQVVVLAIGALVDPLQEVQQPAVYALRVFGSEQLQLLGRFVERVQLLRQQLGASPPQRDRLGRG